MMDRREFFKKSGAVLAGASGALSLPVLSSCSSELPPAQRVLEGKRWGMVIDLTKCPSDCTVCLDACREENNVALHHDDRWDVHWIRKVEIQKEDESHGGEKKSVLLMCNHCDDPPCAQVCRCRPPTSGRTGSLWWITTGASGAGTA
jgi:tetrathionate reductase subunit B